MCRSQRCRSSHQAPSIRRCGTVSRAGRAERWEDAETIAMGIRVPGAIGDFLILRAARESDGKALTVGDPAIRRAVTSQHLPLGLVAVLLQIFHERRAAGAERGVLART